jgi:hypothetical protein
MTKQELAKTLGLTERQINRLLVERTIPPAKKGGFDLEHVACYVKYLRRGEGVQKARQAAYEAAAIDRRARTAARLRHTLTDEEISVYVTNQWLVFLDAWRRCEGEVRAQFCSLGASKEDARAASGDIHNAVCTIMGMARDYAREKLEALLRTVVDDKRVDKLMAQFEEATEE